MVDRKLKVLMLGWEFPPQIAGGLGTACEGLTRALAQHNLQIHFFMPRLYGNESAPHLDLYDVTSGITQKGTRPGVRIKTQWLAGTEVSEYEDYEKLMIYDIPSFLTPYIRPEHKRLSEAELRIIRSKSVRDFKTLVSGEEIFSKTEESVVTGDPSVKSTQHYGHHLFEEVNAYARRAVALSRSLDFDVIHAHDWMTYLAAIAIGRVSGKPVILHVHSLESDRSGMYKNDTIAHIEESSLKAATLIVAVSHYTRRRVIDDYKIPEQKIFTVHNGLSERTCIAPARKDDDVYRVLFLGRVTFQKGPDYFVEAALRTLKHLPNTQFVLAGSGDMLEQLRSKIHNAGAEKNFLLPGFLRGHEVDQIFASSDLYVMPSVSEPFGLSALEALYYDVPIIVSRQSGVSEVIRHALKADFWDIEELADLIVGALKYPQLRRDLLQMAKQEVKRLDWNASASRLMEIYRTLT
ncbi:MAG: glycosyltransferase [Bdellovibrio sp.]|nr:glycosyltransferase [Bdellovibrio sp.]